MYAGEVEIMSDGVGVIVPLYNARAWIRATLESVLRQTYPPENIELIVIDDGSSDDGAEIARRFLADRSVRGVVSGGENAGVSAARNRGWRRSSAEWIQFL